jgi:hypothetical protein
MWLQRAANRAPDDLRILALLADAELRSGDSDAAEATIKRGLEREPDNAAFLALSRRLR